jgi:hypothetical protein
MPFLVRYPIGIDCILDLIFPANLSLGCNYAKFPFLYLKPLASQYANLATNNLSPPKWNGRYILNIFAFLDQSNQHHELPFQRSF